ncbi:MAG TPA: ribbon-helix-helix domain-containing protein [Alphaproteobacteria bacterium]|jgi:predicted DNA-binding ribbon-helix-helix protein|nr:ribbon-helix-helix domain-containing protein [Alphaproteobacteria bacterium]
MSEGDSRIRKRSVRLAGHRTSVSIEEPFWAELAGIAKTRGLSLDRLIAEIDRERSGNLSSAIRLFVLADLKARHHL